MSALTWAGLLAAAQRVPSPFPARAGAAVIGTVSSAATHYTAPQDSRGELLCHDETFSLRGA
ncbi:hypothetical protein [Streptomyces collinus]|uniref:Uncharacterized protein n=1 Tax=Streptomyces collinus (strain DSM 40733 / Tue 365) TaxID=1214242 RepID=S5UW89_STRC3|nr:hypothetical protein [Streptomyces collinus]AGS67299.1 hypothetical protein B446_02335 [Streptomyces collinus Tu 365]AGS73396.1 hypothetical protein B446_32960 [Streptomyces collinus Tu 365]